MNIVIDARWIFPSLSGVGRYTQELIRALLALDTDNDYILLHNNPEVEARLTQELQLDAQAHAVLHHLPYGLFSVANQFQLGGLLKQLNADIFHSTNYMIPLLPFKKGRQGRVACVSTMHDLIPLLFRDHAPRSKKARLFWVYKRLMTEVAQRSDALIAVSESSKRDILKAFKLKDPTRVHTVYNGLGEQFCPSDAPKNNTILYVGRMDPYKNVPLLIRAFVELAMRMPDVRLELVAENDPRYPEAGELIGAAGLTGRVTWHRGLSDADLVAAYQRAAVTVLPSRYEGFGLPVLESMACGTPVVCSRNSSLPEVGGDAALYLEGEDPYELAARLEQVLTDPVLAKRLRDQGLQQARQFSWTRCAEETLAVYRTFQSPEPRA